jgi:hypothetical protein
VQRVATTRIVLGASQDNRLIAEMSGTLRPELLV